MAIGILIQKLEFEVKNWYIHITNSCPTTWGVIVGSGNSLEGFYTLFSPFNPTLNFLKFHLNSCVPPP